MVVDDPFCIAHAAVANLDGIAVEYFSKLTTTRGGDSLSSPSPYQHTQLTFGVFLESVRGIKCYHCVGQECEGDLSNKKRDCLVQTCFHGKFMVLPIIITTTTTTTKTILTETTTTNNGNHNNNNNNNCNYNNNYKEQQEQKLQQQRELQLQINYTNNYNYYYSINNNNMLDEGKEVFVLTKL